MTKQDVVRKIADELVLTQRDANLVVSSVLDSIVSGLRDEERVMIRGFGTFRTRHRPARMARNPYSGTTVAVPARNVPRFSPSKRLREAVSRPGRTG